MGMSESPPRSEPTAGQAGAAAESPGVFTRLRLAVGTVAAVALLAGLLIWLGAQSDRRRGEGTANRQEPPPLDPAAVLGLSPELPTTAEALNQEAFKICERLTRDLPHRPEAYAVAAFIFNRHGRTTDAADVWQKALQVNPRFASAYLGLGTVATKKGDYQEAVPLLREAIELDPAVEQAYRLLVDALLHQGQAEEALTVARQYANRFPRSADSHYWVGRAYSELGQYNEAKQSGEEAVRLDPNFTQAYFALANVCARLGESDPARVHREKFAQLKEQDAEADRKQKKEYQDLAIQQALAASYYLAAGRVHADFGDPRKAEAHWLRGAAIAPALAECRGALVSFYIQANRPAAAVRQLDRLTAAAPENPTHWIQRGRLQAELGQLEAAEASYRQAVKIAPDQVPGYAGLIELALHYQRPMPDATVLAEKAANLAPSAQAYLRLSAVRDRQGDRPGAIAAAKRAVELEPRDMRVHAAYDQLLSDPR
jgi:tetratricopeptide (TPR) repeat protein